MVAIFPVPFEGWERGLMEQVTRLNLERVERSIFIFVVVVVLFYERRRHFLFFANFVNFLKRQRERRRHQKKFIKTGKKKYIKGENI
jgi:hypothetical protein